jgi:integrase/recombinase XerD
MSIEIPALEESRTRFLEALRVQGRARDTIRSRHDSLTTLFLYLATQCINDVRAVTRETIRSYLLWLSGQDYSPWTVSTHWQSVRRFFAWLEKTDAVLLDPCAGVISPKIGERLPRAVLSESQAKAILDQPDTQTKKGIRDKAILEVFYASALRLEEVTRLTVYDVDIQNGFVRVNQGKGSRDRVVPIGYKAADYVKEYLQNVRLPWSGQQKDERALWLSAIEPHRPMGKQAISVTVRDYMRAAGIKQGRAHLWRHACATHLVASGANIAYVQRLLGHSQISTTQRYSHVTASDVKQMFEKKHPRERRKKSIAPDPHSITKRR